MKHAPCLLRAIGRLSSPVELMSRSKNTKMVCDFSVILFAKSSTARENQVWTDERRPYPGMQHQTLPFFYGYKDELIDYADTVVYCAICIQTVAREGDTKRLFRFLSQIVQSSCVDGRPAVAYPKSKSTACMQRHVNDHHRAELLAACVTARREMCAAAKVDATKRRRTQWTSARLDTWTLAFVG